MSHQQFLHFLWSRYRHQDFLTDIRSKESERKILIFNICTIWIVLTLHWWNIGKWRMSKVQKNTESLDNLQYLHIYCQPFPALNKNRMMIKNKFSQTNCLLYWDIASHFLQATNPAWSHCSSSACDRSSHWHAPLSASAAWTLILFVR